MKLFAAVTILMIIGASMMEVSAKDCGCSNKYSPVCGSVGQPASRVRTFTNRCHLRCEGGTMHYRGQCK